MNVSVVLPVYNGAPTIGRAIASILHQTLADLELIVVDDGSTDGTVNVVQQFTDPRINLIRTSHAGVIAAANAGTQLANSPFIARMDADDFSHPQRLARQLELLTDDDLDAVGCQVRIVDGEQRPIESMQRYQRWINEETYSQVSIAALRFVEFPLVNPTIVARRRYFELQFQDNGFPEDYDLMLRAAALGMRFGKVPEQLFDWVDHPHGLTRTHPRYSDEAFMNCRRHHLQTGPLHGHKVIDFWGLGKTGKPWLRWLQSEGFHVRRAYAVAERKVGKKIHEVMVQHTSELAPADGHPIIIAVGAAGAREVILPQLEAQRYRIGQDAWFVA